MILSNRKRTQKVYKPAVSRLSVAHDNQAWLTWVLFRFRHIRQLGQVPVPEVLGQSYGLQQPVCGLNMDSGINSRLPKLTRSRPSRFLRFWIIQSFSSSFPGQSTWKMGNCSVFRTKCVKIPFIVKPGWWSKQSRRTMALIVLENNNLP